MICGSGGSTSRLAKAAGAEPAGQMRDAKLHAVVARSTFRRQNVQNTQLRSTKTLQPRSTFGRWDVQKVYVVMARRTLRTQNAQSTSASEHFWKLRCSKSARLCGAKMREAHLEVKMYKAPHVRLVEVEMFKKCMPLWREAHFEAKSLKNWRSRATFDVQMSFRMAGTRACALSSTLHTPPPPSTLHPPPSTLHPPHSTLHTPHSTLHTPHSTLHTPHSTLHTPLHTPPHHHTTTTLKTTTTTTTTLHHTSCANYITLHYTPLRSPTLHYIQIHYTTRHDTTLHYTDYNYNYNYNYNSTTTTTTLDYATPNYTTLRYTQLH